MVLDRTDSTLAGCCAYPVAALLCALLLTGCSDARPAWQALPPAPVARTEVVGAPLSGRVAVVGGLTADGRASARVDLYDPRRERWLRLPDLPEGLHHAMAASRAGRLYVVGGYRIRGGASGRPATGPGCSSTAAGGRCRGCPSRAPRGARPSCATASTSSAGRPRRAPGTSRADSLHLDLRTLRWQGFAGLARPREHLGVTALGGRIYAIGGRTAGLESNTAAADAYDPRRAALVAPARRPHPPGRQRRDGGRRPRGRRRRRGPGRHDPPRLTPSTRRAAPGAACRAARGPGTGWRSSASGARSTRASAGPKPGLTVSPTLLSLRVPAPALRSAQGRLVAGGEHLEAGREVERRARERRGRGHAHQQAGLARHELGGGDVDGAPPAEPGHGVGAAGGRVAQRQRQRPERAEAPHAPVEVARGVADARRRGPLQHQQLEPLAGLGAGVERRAVEPGPAPALGDELLAGAVVAHQAERHVGHRPPLGHRGRGGEGRHPALGVEAAVDRVEHDHRRAAAGQLALAELLADQGQRPAAGPPARRASRPRRCGRPAASRRRPRPAPSGSARRAGGQRAQLGGDAVAGAPERAEPGVGLRARARPAQPSTSEWKATPVRSFGKK